MLTRSLAASLLALALITPAHANDGAFYGTGATVFPVQDDAIALDTEQLTIRQAGPTADYYVDHWQVEVVYGFRNTTDKAVTVQMGFPEWCVQTPDNYEDLPEKCAEWTIRDFTIQIDGTPAKATVKRATPGKDTLAEMDYHRVHTFPVTFAPNQRRTIRHTYHHRGAISSPWCSEMTYILKTGALWKGAIKQLDITAEVIDRFKQVTDYDGWLEGTDGKPKATVEKTANGTIYRWALRDHEPKHDLGLLLCEPDGVARLEAMAEVTGLDEETMRGMTPEALRIARNTFYAAYGYDFKSDDLKAHFGKTGWYRPRADFDQTWIGPYRTKQIALMKRIEAEKKAGGKKAGVEKDTAKKDTVKKDVVKKKAAVKKDTATKKTQAK